MDFVVFGFGLGALLMLAGFALRDLGPRVLTAPGHAVEADESPFELARQTLWRQALSSASTGIILGGAGIAAVTAAALAAQVVDRTGAIVVGVAAVLACVGVGAWTYDTLRRHRLAIDTLDLQEHEYYAAQHVETPRRRAAEPAPRPEAERMVAAEATEPAANEPPATEVAASGAESIDQPDHDEAEHDFDAPLPAWSTVPAGPAVPYLNGKTREVIPAAKGQPGPAPETSPSDRSGELPAAAEPDLAALEPWPAAVNGADVADDTPAEEPGARGAGAVPSWLFENLEDEVAAGSAAKEDPIDPFKGARPVRRSSALERLLSEETLPPTEEVEGEDERVARRRPENRPR